MRLLPNCVAKGTGCRQRSITYVLAVAVVILSGCGGPSSAPSAIELRYEVAHAGVSDGEAHVSYMLPSGETRSESVGLPWSSQVFHFDLGSELSLSAEATPHPTANLQCSVIFPTASPYGRVIGNSGERSCVVVHRF